MFSPRKFALRAMLVLRGRADSDTFTCCAMVPVSLNKAGRSFEGTALLRFSHHRLPELSGDYWPSGRGAGPERYRPDAHAHAVEYRQQRSRRAELHWRITLVFYRITYAMALMVVPLSVVKSNVRASCLCCPPCCFIFAVLPIQTSIKSNGGKGKLTRLFDVGGQPDSSGVGAIGFKTCGIQVPGPAACVPVFCVKERYNAAICVLDRYIGKIIFTTIMMTLFMLVSLSDHQVCRSAEKAGQGNYDALGAGMYTLLSVPKDIQIFFPGGGAASALLGLGMLAQRSELVVMQASASPSAGGAVGDENGFHPP